MAIFSLCSCSFNLYILDVTHVCGQVVFKRQKIYKDFFFCWICFCCSILWLFAVTFNLSRNCIMNWGYLAPAKTKCLSASELHTSLKRVAQSCICYLCRAWAWPLRYKKLAGLGLTLAGKVVGHPLPEARLASFLSDIAREFACPVCCLYQCALNTLS